MSALASISKSSLFALVLMSIMSTNLLANPAFRSERIVIVQEGETLSQIVERELRSALVWPAIAKHNNIANGARIYAGQIIRIPQAYSRSRESAIVLFSKGDVLRRASSPDRDKKLQRTDQIRVGDEILTGKDGFASVEFGAGSIINIQPDSHVLIVDLNCDSEEEPCVIDLYTEKGGVRSQIPEQIKQPVRFRIFTPNSSAAVRGTVFDISADNAKSSAGVTRGSVAVSAEGSTTGVENGYGVLAYSGEPPGAPRLLIDAPQLLNVPVRLAKGDSLSWWANDQAKSYQVQISADENGSEVHRTASTNTSAYVAPGGLSGEFYLSIRPVDSLGLKGLPVSTPVQLVSIDESSQLPAVSAELNDDMVAFTLSEGVKNANSYELQVSDDAAFSAPLSYDVQSGEGLLIKVKPGSKRWTRARALYANYVVGNYSDVVQVQRP